MADQFRDSCVDRQNKNRKGCIEELSVELEKIGKEIGVGMIMTPASNIHFQNKLEKLQHGGFTDVVKNYFKRI